MIYQPYLVFDLRLQLALGIFKASVLALQDFIAGDNKEWIYYAGAANGYMAAATGIPGASATLYAIGSQVNVLVNRSPDGGLAQIYLNGILASQVDTYLDNILGDWMSFSVGILPGVLNRIDIVNAVNPNPEKTSTINWLALGPVEAGPLSEVQLRSRNVITLVFRIRDAEQNSPLASVPFYLPDGLTIIEVQAFADAVAPELDAATEGQIAEAVVTFGLTLPGGLKANAVTRSVNERGGLITFDTAGPRASSFRIPAIDHTIMPGDSFALNAPAIAALIARLTSATTAANIRPTSEQGYNFTTARAGKKSLRR